MVKVFVNMLDCMYISEEQLKRKLEKGGIDWSKPIRTVQEMDGNWYIQEEEIKLMDLKDFLNLQGGLDNVIMERLKQSGKTISSTDLLNSKLLALVTEVGEFANELGSHKYWKQKHNVDDQEALTEFADILFFYLSIANLLGYSAEQIQTAYMDKWHVNIRRQKDNY